MVESNEPVSGMNCVPSVVYGLAVTSVRRAIGAPPFIFDQRSRLGVDSRLSLASVLEIFHQQAMVLQKSGKDVFVRRRSSLKISNMRMMFVIASNIRVPSFQETLRPRVGWRLCKCCSSSDEDGCRGI